VLGIQVGLTREYITGAHLSKRKVALSSFSVRERQLGG